MNAKSLARLLSVGVIVFPILASAQAERRPPRQFPEFVGTWVLDQSAGAGHIAGLPLASTIRITASPTEVSVVKDANAAEIYRFDGTESAATGPRADAILGPSLQFFARRRGFGSHI